LTDVGPQTLTDDDLMTITYISRIINYMIVQITPIALVSIHYKYYIVSFIEARLCSSSA
jgi:hypothetical protein